jgi:hypothetical protein
MKYFASAVALLVLIFIFSEAGYFYIEYFHQQIKWDKEIQSSHNTIYNNNSKQIYIGIVNERLNDFDSMLKDKGKIREVIEFKDSSDYYGLFSKSINMHLLIREKNDTVNKYHVRINGSFDGLCSPQGARERVMLMLRQIEYDKMPHL